MQTVDTALRIARQPHSMPEPPAARRAPRGPGIVAIGGGTGLPAVLRGLAVALRCDRSAIGRLTALVTVTDDGGSSGVLRRELGMLPPGDVRNCLVALASDACMLKGVLQHRFAGDTELAGHALGNLVLAALVQQTGSFLTAVDALAEILNLDGRVLPVTESNAQLKAELATGEIRCGETNIVAARTRIRRIGFDRDVRPMPDAIRELVNADVVVVGPGSLYTSILPNLLVTGVASTISGLNAVRVYVANLMTQPGETDGYSLEDHLRAIREHTHADLFDYVLVNTSSIAPAALASYAAQGAEPVRREAQETTGEGVVTVERELLSQSPDGKIRHSPEALADAILELTHKGRGRVFIRRM
jgi:uncharacterized cofD-like protein